MKQTTKIKIESLKDAVYMIAVIETNCGHVWNEFVHHTFTDMLDILMNDFDSIDEAVDYLDAPIGYEWTINEEFQVDTEDNRREPMLMIRIK